jgi:hypothetical protein
MKEGHQDFERENWPKLFLLAQWLLTFWVICKKTVLGKLGFAIGSNSFFVDGLGKKCRMVKEGSASWRALEVLYDHEPRETGDFGDRLDNFWLRSPNAQAVRNRLKIVTNEINREINRLSQTRQGRPIRIASIACGSARAVFQCVREASLNCRSVEFLLLDIDPAAIEHALVMAERYGIRDCVRTEILNVFMIGKLEKVLADYKPDIVEMVGLLDYLKDKRAVRIFTAISRALASDGVLITCNVVPNAEARFLKWVVDWPMIYRTRHELQVLLEDHFGMLQFLLEPWGIHAVVSARQKPLASRSSGALESLRSLEARYVSGDEVGREERECGVSCQVEDLPFTFWSVDEGKANKLGGSLQRSEP